jgi:hypothetical protein
MFRFTHDAVGEQAYYGLHSGVLGVKENTYLPGILLVLKAWLQNAGVEGGG